MFRLDDRVAVVTGGGAGIGEAVSDWVARLGASVVINDIDNRAASRVATRINDLHPGRALAVTGDATDERVAHDLAAAARRKFGNVHILVNNAAAFVDLLPFLDLSEQDWSAGMSSYVATLRCMKAFLPGMVLQGYGRVVNITSIGGSFGGVHMSVYAAAKGAIHALTMSVAKEVAGNNVTINCVAPGTVDTPRQQKRSAEVREERARRIPVGRFASAEEIASAVVFLASTEASYITGEIICVDGGRP